MRIFKYTLLFVACLFLISCQSGTQDIKIPTATLGLLDLKGWNFQTHGPIQIKGEWEFYWEQLLLPLDFENPNLPKKTVYMYLPQIWNGNLIDDKKIKGNGYATLRLKILTDYQSQNIGFKLGQIHSAYALWINGKNIFENGIVSKTAAIPRHGTQVIFFENNSEIIDIIFHIANFDNISGGIQGNIIIGLQSQIIRIYNNACGIELFFIGCFFVGAIYHFCLFFLRRKEPLTLYFAIGYLLGALRTATVGEVILVQFFQDIPWELVNKISFSAVYLGIPILLLFIYHIFPKEINKQVIHLLCAIGFICEGITLVFSTRIYQQIFYIFQYIIFFILIYIVIIFIQALIRKRDGALLIIIGTFIFLLTIINDILVWNQVLKFPYLLHIGLFATFFSQSLFIARKFSKTLVENEYFNLNLESKVLERTMELNKAKQIIEETSKLKTNLFINMAHEIRNPLTLIRNYLQQYIKKTGMTIELEIMKQNIDKLCRDIVNFLDSKKLEKGQIFYNHDQEINLSDLIKQKIPIFSETAKIHELTLTEHIEDDIIIMADPSAIERILNNLFNNAVKYSHKKGIIDITLKSDKNDILLIFKDNGIGISIEQQKYIFTPYYQISHKKRNIQGIGMGLYIVSKIVESLNGKIHVDSIIGKGSIFTIQLKNHVKTHKNIYTRENIYSPAKETLMENFIYPTTNKDKIIENKSTILVVEDNQDLLNYLKTHLEPQYHIFTAINGKNALSRIKDTPKPELIISDIMMDEMDGITLCNEIMNNDKFMDIPFLFISAKTADQEKIKGLATGAIDYISKPFLFDELLQKIESILNNRGKHREATIHEMEKKISILFRETKNNEFDSYKKNFAKYQLTEREKDIAQELLKGLENKEISDRLKLSPHTVRNYISRIYKKCDVSNRVEFVNLINS